MAMDKGAREAYKKAGLTLPGKMFFGNENTMLRAEMLAAGAAYDGSAVVWIFPDFQMLQKFRDLRSPKGQGQGQVPAAAAPRVYPQPPPVPPAGSPVPLPDVRSLSLPPAPPPMSAAELISFTKKALGGPAAQVQVTESEAKLLDFVPARARVEQDKAEGPVQQPLFDTAERNADGSLKLLRIQPSRYVVINVPLYGPRKTTQRKQKREKGESLMYRGVEAVKIHTESDQLIVNPEEHQKAKELQGRIGSRLRRLGTCVVDGLVAVPLSALPEYEKVKAECKNNAWAFNSGTRHWKVIVNCIELEMVKRTEEEELARLAAYEIQRIMDDMKEAINSMSPERIKSAAAAAKAKAAALAPGIPQGALFAAVDSARKAANTITREVSQLGRTVEQVRSELDLSAVESARFAFLEFQTPMEAKAILTADTALPPEAVADDRFANLEK